MHVFFLLQAGDDKDDTDVVVDPRVAKRTKKVGKLMVDMYTDNRALMKPWATDELQSLFIPAMNLHSIMWVCFKQENKSKQIAGFCVL